MNEIEKRISFEDYLSKKEGPARQRRVLVDDFVFGHGMQVSRFQIMHGTDVICEEIANGPIRFAKMLRKFLSKVAIDDSILQNILFYASQEEEGARRFTVITEDQYLNELEKQRKTGKEEGFRNRTRYREFYTKNSKYYLSVDVNICEQLEFCCEVIPEADRKDWFFCAIPTYEPSSSIEFQKRCNAIEDKIKRDRKKAIQELAASYNKGKKTKKKIQNNTQSTPNRRLRDSNLVAITKLIAGEVCELADEGGKYHKAPVFEGYGPYLEVHHIKWLAKNGTDTLDNVVALCPTCHRKMHIVANKQDINKLKKVAKKHNDMWLNLIKSEISDV